MFKKIGNFFKGFFSKSVELGKKGYETYDKLDPEQKEKINYFVEKTAKEIL